RGAGVAGTPCRAEVFQLSGRVYRRCTAEFAAGQNGPIPAAVGVSTACRPLVLHLLLRELSGRCLPAEGARRAPSGLFGALYRLLSKAAGRPHRAGRPVSVSASRQRALHTGAGHAWATTDPVGTL